MPTPAVREPRLYADEPVYLLYLDSKSHVHSHASTTEAFCAMLLFSVDRKQRHVNSRECPIDICLALCESRGSGAETPSQRPLSATSLASYILCEGNRTLIRKCHAETQLHVTGPPSTSQKDDPSLGRL